MSSTARGGKRSPADYYPTPAFCVNRLLEACSLPQGTWLEPAAGDGAIIRAVQSFGPYNNHWVAVEKRKACLQSLKGIAKEVFIGDFLKESTAYEGAGIDVVISNDPFSLAMEFIEKTLPIAPWVCHLLRLNFLGTAERNEFFRNNMPDIYVIPDRVSFAQSVTCAGCDFWRMVALTKKAPRTCPRCGDKTRVSSTDSIEYAWMVWGPVRARTAGKIEVLRHTPLDSRK